ncbi:fibrinogen C domain-containing protein 1 isoform X2 [Ceratitis capitata]|uniref:fibrinogen C domain-containing protein 1 isoform X2 n=1 Tax=Ceratitis capitata TaxID=7213 RepID=UPI000A1065BD|nr:fibrinogen C domain-containing protein 1 isoform X2 [Ceratitis capitata]
MAQHLLLLSILLWHYFFYTVKCQTPIQINSKPSPFHMYFCNDELLKETVDKVEQLDLKLDYITQRLDEVLSSIQEPLLREMKNTLESFEFKMVDNSNQRFEVRQRQDKKASTCAGAMIQRNGTFAKSSTYYLHIPEYLPRPFAVYCLQDPDGGEPWTIIQRRLNDRTNFYRGWNEYEHGFGNLFYNHFLGLDKIHALTQSQSNELWVQLESFSNETSYAKYETFAIDGASGKYALSVLGKYIGTAGDSLRFQWGQKFSTKDSDNDVSPEHCAQQHRGAWWYKDCLNSNLNA